MFTNVLEKWSTDWTSAVSYFDPAAPRPQTDSHLNSVSIEYPENEICNATQNFDPASMLGSGTFGSVYKGTMKDGTEVAIKVLQVPEEAGFEDEVKVLSRFRHPNLVILMGFSRHISTGGRSLVYEYLSGGDVSKRLQSSRNKVQQFEWRLRISASLDAASGLSHLHNANPRAFHRDIKGPNILLDKNGGAKMADFGLSCVSMSSHHKVAQASGTVGYACSEYIRTGIITEGSEVHSFGMVLLELLTGAPPAVQRPDKPSEFCYLVDHLKGSLTKVIEMLDKSGHFPVPMAQKLSELAFRCIHHRPVERPAFVQIVGELRRLLAEADEANVDPNVQSYNSNVQAMPNASAKQSSVPPAQRPQRTPTPPAEAQAASQMAAAGQVGFSPGQVVEVRKRGGPHWMRARISRANPNNTFSVRYDDNDYEDSVAVYFIRALDTAPLQGMPNMQVLDRGQAQNMQSLIRANQQAAPSRSERPLPAPPPQEGRYAHGQQQMMNAVAPPPPTPQRGGSAQVPHDRTSISDISNSGMAADASQGLWCRLTCVFAEGVSDLARLRDNQRNIDFPKTSMKLVIGRNKQASMLWDTLVPDSRLRGTVSREHFEITVQRDHTAGFTFGLNCLSLNGVLLNREFVRPGDSERRMQHGDILAFAANLDAPPDRSPAPAGALPRKPFLHFLFELPPPTSANPSPAPAPLQEEAPAAWSPREEEAEAEPYVKLPDGAVAGTWRKTSSNSQAEALFCLEVHGDSVHTNLPSEARKLVFESGELLSPPALRVGRLYQCGFWKRVLKADGRGGSNLDSDIFEIRTTRKNNPATREPPEWRYRVRVLSARGVVLKYSTVLQAGEERELQPSDTITVDMDSKSSPAGGRSLLGGLHFTFIPYNAATSLSPSHGAALEVPRVLPDFSDAADDGIGGMQLERTYAAPARSASNYSSSSAAKTAGALRAPMGILVEPDSGPAGGSAATQNGNRLGSEPLGTIMLETGGDPDDLFSKTGFGSAPSEERMPALTGSGAGYSSGRPARRGEASVPAQQPRGGQPPPGEQGNWFQQLPFFSK